jgi:Cd2+/Zn2+-exporting ATPase
VFFFSLGAWKETSAKVSVPTAFAAAIGGLTGHGILVCGGTPLEVAAHAVNEVLDKTGTITTGEPKVAGIEAFDLSQDKLIDYAKGLGRALHELGIRRVELATGDNEASEAGRVAELIGV